jgi:actin-related protein
MERNNKVMWIQEFKIALIEEDTQKLTELADADLAFETVEEMQEAMYLIQQAEIFFDRLKNETALSMQQLKKNIDFLRSTEAPAINKLDITS